MSATCNLCNSDQLTFIGQDNRNRRTFYLCGECELVSVPKVHWVNLKDEKLRYDLHDNSESNDGYVGFLSEIADAVAAAADSAFPNRPPASPPLSKSAPIIKLLDFGCGKNAVLGHVLDKTGMAAGLGIDYCGYDPFYDHLPLPGAGKFDIIVACEVMEHVRDIRGELELMNSLLRGGGTIILRTLPYGRPSAFPGWFYASDPTHINFFNKTSLERAAAAISKRVVATDGEREDIFSLR
ncbi:MAG: class I SAM-dependent methyltransferase [Chitinispirillales bacterium]|jgi:2-polyprenyl-3-methyl-5-hydroxy-6-metoxy-1,4-benzoquinol methylase|nr:class I SAM-dependent methyltransferase [Chitinispirillales bacterium]